MSNIRLTNLSKPEDVKYKKQFTYADVNFDFVFSDIDQKELNSSVKNSDLKANYDLGAIKNSIVNIFTSFPGDKILNPNFGLNLNQFLFLPCSKETARLIGETIQSQIKLQEPRVNLKTVNVVANINNDEYNITMLLEVPFINNNNSINFKALLNSTGINFYN